MKAITKSRARLMTLTAVAAAAIVAATMAVLPGDNASARLAIGTTLDAAEQAVPAVAYSAEALDLGAAEKQPTPVATRQPATPTTAKRTAAAPETVKPKAVSTRPTAAPTDELAEARRILAGLIARYPILKGATVSFGDAKGHQAICYYKSGRIVISPTHTASLSRILNHEVWHIIDWRDNGRIDWGENVPPR